MTKNKHLKQDKSLQFYNALLYQLLKKKWKEGKFDMDWFISIRRTKDHPPSKEDFDFLRSFLLKDTQIIQG